MPDFPGEPDQAGRRSMIANGEAGRPGTGSYKSSLVPSIQAPTATLDVECGAAMRLETPEKTTRPSHRSAEALGPQCTTGA